jgi:RhtB (resistance to homoserine/threonine) family protein
MFGIINFGAFVLAGILLAITPGSDTMFILGNSISNGKKAGILSALGINTGSLFHTAFAAFGLSILLSESVMAFNIVKYLGAAYLIYLGIKSILNKQTVPKDEFNKTAKSNKKIYMSGILTNILNPKVALFYLAFLPQFIDPNYSNHYFSFLVLGLSFTMIGTIWCLILAIYSSKFSMKLRENKRFNIWLHKLTGLVFISLGIKLALSRK